MIGPEIAVDWRLIGAVLAGLFFFGCCYNALVQHLGEKKNGYTSLLVVGGVLVTLGGVALISWQSAALSLACFAASGIAMVIGDIWRSIKRQDAALAVLREGHEGRDGQ